MALPTPDKNNLENINETYDIEQIYRGMVILNEKITDDNAKF